MCPKRSSPQRGKRCRHSEKRSSTALMPSCRSLISGLMVAFLASSQIIEAAVVNNPKATYTFTNAASDLSTLALIVNGIALEQGLKDGSVNKIEMIDELFNLNVSLDVIEKENVTGLVDELTEIGSAVEKGCGGGGGQCIDTKIIRDGVGAVKLVWDGADEAGGELRGPLTLLLKAKELYEMIQNAKTASKKLIGLLEKRSTIKDNKKNAVSNYIVEVLGDLRKTLDPRSEEFEELLKFVKEDTTTEYAFLESVNKVILVGNRTSNMVSSLSSFKSELTKATLLSSSLDPFLSSDKLSSIEKKLKLATAVGSIGAIKKLTTGLFNGYSDIKNFSLVQDTSIVKKMLAPNVTTKSLIRLFSGLMKEGEAMKPLQNISGFQSSLSKVQPDITTILQLTKNSSKDVDTLKLLEQLNGCGPTGDFSTSFDFKGWEEEKKLLGTLANGASEFITLVKNSQASFTTTKIEEFSNAIGKIDLMAIFKNINAFKEMNEVITELQTLQKSLSHLLPAAFKAYSDSSNLNSLVENADWLKKFEQPGTTCLSTSADFIRSANPEVTPISVLLNLRPDNLKPVIAAVATLKPTLTAWKQFKTARKTRSAKSDEIPKLKNALELSQKISAGVKVVRYVAKVDELKEDLKAVFSAEKEIDAGVNALPAEQKAEVVKTWNAKTKKEMKTFLKDVQYQSGPIIKTQPDRIITFHEVFHDVHHMEVPNFNGELLALRLSSLKAPAGIQAHLKAIGTLNLQKTSGSVIKGYLKTNLTTIEKYFDEVFDINRDSENSKREAEEGPVLTWIIIGIVVAVLIVLAAIGGLFCHKMKKTDADEKNKKDVEEGSENGDKGSKNGGKGKGKDSKNKKNSKKSKSGEAAKSSGGSNEPASKVSTSKTGDSTASGLSGAPSKEQQKKQDEMNMKTLKELKKKSDIHVNPDGKTGIVLSKEEYPEEHPSSIDVEEKQALFRCKTDKSRRHVKNYALQRRIENRRYGCDPKKVYSRKTDEDQRMVKQGDNKSSDDLKGDDLKKFIKACKLNERESERNKILLEQFLRRIAHPDKITMPRHSSISMRTINKWLKEYKNRGTYQKPENYTLKVQNVSHSFRINSPTAQKMNEELYLEMLANKGYDDHERPELDDTQLSQASDMDSQLEIKTANDLSEEASRPTAGSDHEESDMEMSDSENNDEERDFSPEAQKRLRAEISRIAFRRRKGYFRSLVNLYNIWCYNRNEDKKQLRQLYTENEMERVEAGRNCKELKFPEPKIGRNGKFKFSEEFLKESLEAMLNKYFVNIERRFNCLYNKHPISDEMFEAMSEEAAEAFKTEPALLNLNIQPRYVGDVHGAYKEFVTQCMLNLQDSKSTMVFLGDYVDRGTRGLDIFYLMCILKLLFPTKFYFLRGNHETAEVNTFHGFNAECRFTFGEKIGEKVFTAVNETFAHLPLAAIVNKTTFMSHGGISPRFLEKDGLDLITKFPRKKNASEIHVFNDLIWGDPRTMLDPRDFKRTVFHPSKRTELAVHYNANAVREVMKVHGFELVIRAHEVKKEGIDFFADGKVVTIFGITNSGDDNKSSQLVQDEFGTIRVIQFENCVSTKTVDENTVRLKRSKPC